MRETLAENLAACAAGLVLFALAFGLSRLKPNVQAQGARVSGR